MTGVSKREKLGRAIAEFMWKYGDWYELRDCYDSFEDFVTETISSLYNSRERNEIAKDLYTRSKQSDDEKEASKASILYRKVVDI